MNESRSSVGSTRRATFDSQLAVEPVVEVAGGEVLPLAGQGRVVDGEQHAQGRLVDLDAGQGARVSSASAIVSPMSTVGQADDRDDVAGLGLLDLDAAELVEDAARCRSCPATLTPPAFRSAAFWPRLTVPETIRPMAIRPTYSEKSSVVQSI